jgi:hypothetical protein
MWQQQSVWPLAWARTGAVTLPLLLAALLQLPCRFGAFSALETWALTSLALLGCCIILLLCIWPFPFLFLLACICINMLLPWRQLQHLLLL